MARRMAEVSVRVRRRRGRRPESAIVRHAAVATSHGRDVTPIGGRRVEASSQRPAFVGKRDVRPIGTCGTAAGGRGLELGR